MDISKIVFDPKHRNNWSAIDLGFILARKWYKPLLLAWCMISLPLFLLLLLLPEEYLFWSILVIWWLKPLWDRGPLVIASRALFDEQLSLKALLHDYRQLLKPGLLSWLTLFRLSPGRSFLQPIHVLEKLHGKTFSQRSNILQRNMRSAHVYLTIACVHFEAILSIGLLSFVALLIPNEVNIDYWEWISQQQTAYLYLTNIVSYCAMALVAPFYCVTGFILYINRRILLEGWDIEINFRLLAERLQEEQQTTNKRGTVANCVAALCLTGLLFTTTIDKAWAEPVSEVDTERTAPIEAIETAKQAHELIERIYAGPEYLREKQVTGYRWRFSNDENNKSENDDKDHPFLEWLADLVKEWFGDLDFSEGDLSSLFTIASIIKILLISMALGFLCYLFYRAHQWYLQNRDRFRRRSTAQAAKPAVLFGLDVSENSLPENIADQVMALWQQESHREAMALLYRAVLIHLLHDYHFAFADGYTEQECAALVSQSENAEHQMLKDYMWQLTRHWQALAYAHRPLTQDTAFALITDYRVLFDDEQ